MYRHVPINKVEIQDDFFQPRILQSRESTIPYMWDTLHDRVPGVAPSHCIENFRIAAGLQDGAFHGWWFQDSDLWKWLEGVGYALSLKRDAALEAQADSAIDLAEQAQQPDGYLDTYYIINGLDKRFTNLKDNHELYVAGHMFEAACAYYAATGKNKVLDISCRFADCLCENFGPEAEKLHGYPGHEEVEMGLTRLYAVTGEKRYLDLALYFLNERGKQPYYFDEEVIRRGEKVEEMRRDFWQTYGYYQADVPVREQTVARGHAVRQLYLLAGMVEAGAAAGDESLVEAAERVYENIVHKQMYITGGVGSTHVGEAFSFDYDLPPDRCYTETCASIALIMTAIRLHRAHPHGKYGDIVEKALYNGILSGVSLDGKKYFYMNPLETWPQRCETRNDMHIDDERKGWFGCACCPPNVLRTLTGLSMYLYTENDEYLYVDQYVSSDVEAGDTKLQVESSFPWKGEVKITVEKAGSKKLALRIPGWAKKYVFAINGEEMDHDVWNGYEFAGQVQDGDVITLSFPMEVKKMRSHAHIPEYAGKVALMMGPVVYCLEEKENGDELWNLSLTDAPLTTLWQKELLGGVMTIRGEGVREKGTDTLYTDEEKATENQTLTFVPYYAWGNRGKGEMRVWVRKA
ncbi:MAG: glycoside hydrolase family 127 protein [Clostridia bacterium]|nr:glycoside hydrolase family 127 protein [Clostridia bacterium]